MLRNPLRIYNSGSVWKLAPKAAICAQLGISATCIMGQYCPKFVPREPSAPRMVQLYQPRAHPGLTTLCLNPETSRSPANFASGARPGTFVDQSESANCQTTENAKPVLFAGVILQQKIRLDQVQECKFEFHFCSHFRVLL